VRRFLLFEPYGGLLLPGTSRTVKKSPEAEPSFLAFCSIALVREDIVVIISGEAMSVLTQIVALQEDTGKSLNAWILNKNN
jgi:hypothetical protein